MNDSKIKIDSLNSKAIEEFKDSPFYRQSPVTESANKTDEVASRSIKNVRQVNKGAIKIVWIDDFPQSSSDNKEPTTVYYTPKQSFLNWRRRELQAEVKKMQAIKQILREGDREHLAISAEELSGEDKI